MDRGETRTCEHCGRRINVLSRVCPFCGGEVSEPAPELPPLCPRCKVPLEGHRVGTEQYDLCPRCGGLWLDREEFHRATREATVYREEPGAEPYRRAPLEPRVAYVPCVRCGKIMNRKNFARISGVIIDECAPHGLWLDPGELEKIRCFIADGGLEKAQDKEIQRVRGELRGLAARVEQTAFTQKIIHFWNVKRWIFGG